MHESKARTSRHPMSLLGTAVATTCLASPGLGHAQTTTAERPEEIVVTSSMIAQPRRQIGTAVSVIDFEEIELRGYTDLADVLRTQTGIAVSNSGGAGKATSVRIRGEESYRTLLMIDGVKALDPARRKSRRASTSLLTTSDLQRVEVLRGPQGFIYGADAGGVVNVITKRGADDLGGQVGLEFGEYSLRKVDAALSRRRRPGRLLRVRRRSRDRRLQRADRGHGVARRRRRRQHDGARQARLERLRQRALAARRARHRCRDGVRPCFHPSRSRRCTIAAPRPSRRTYKLSAEHRGGDLSNSFGYSNVDIERDNFSQGLSAFATEGSSAGSSTRAATSRRMRWRSSTASTSRTRSSSTTDGARGAAIRRATTSSIKARSTMRCSCRSARVTTTTTISAPTRARA